MDVVADFYLALLEHDKRISLTTIGTVPAVVLTGADDRLIAPDQAAALAAAIPGARLVRVPEAGHMVILERPEVVTAEIRSLVAEATQASVGRRRPA